MVDLQGKTWEKYLKSQLNLDHSEDESRLNPSSNTKVGLGLTAATKAFEAVTRHQISPNPTTHAISYHSWRRFQERVASLPPEICRIILDALLNEVFGSGVVYTHTDTSVTRTFLALNRQLYAKYKDVYWSQSRWIVGKGPANESMRFMTLPPFDNSTSEFSRQVPNQAALKIRHLELHLSKDDLSHPHTQHRLIVKSDGKRNRHQSIRNFQSLERFQSECKGFASEIMQVWQDKFDRVAFLNLHHLTLNFTHAFAPDGVFLGVDAVQRFMPFMYGMPPDLKIVAPSSKYEKEIRNVLENLNEAALQGQTRSESTSTS